MKVKAEIYREMYSNKNTNVADVIPQLIYDVFIADKFGKILSMPNSTAVSVEDFIEKNMDTTKKEYDIYIVDKYAFQMLMREKIENH